MKPSVRELEANEFVLARGGNRAKTMDLVTAFCMKLSDKKAWSIVVKPWSNDRTDKQNRALWGCAYAVLAEFTGHTKEEIHDFLIRKYFGEVEREVMGERKLYPKRTTTTDEHGKRKLIDTRHLKDYYEFIQQWAAENLGAYIPDPDPEYWKEEKRGKAA